MPDVAVAGDIITVATTQEMEGDTESPESTPPSVAPPTQLRVTMVTIRMEGRST